MVICSRTPRGLSTVVSVGKRKKKKKGLCLLKFRRQLGDHGSAHHPVFSYGKLNRCDKDKGTSGFKSGLCKLVSAQALNFTLGSEFQLPTFIRYSWGGGGP